MGNKGLFPGVAVPLAFFCTLFFRHRKKSVSAPWDGKSQSRAGVGASGPARGNRVCCLRAQQGAFRSPPAPLLATEVGEHPIRTASPAPAPESARQALIGEAGVAPAGAARGFPRGKQSARFALPCAPLVVCLNSGSLTAFGGCIHWIPASLRSPLETFWHRS